MPSFGGTGGSIGAGLGAALGATPANGSLGRYTAATDEGGPTYTDMEGNVIGLDAARGTWTGAQPVAPGAGPAVPPSTEGGYVNDPTKTHFQNQMLAKDFEDAIAGTEFNKQLNLREGSDPDVNNNVLSDQYQQNPFEVGSLEYYNDPSFTQYMPDNPNIDYFKKSGIATNPYMDASIYSQEWMGKELAEDKYNYRITEGLRAAYQARYDDKTRALLGYAQGGVVRGYAQGGEIIPDEGLSGYEENLVQGAIAALTGQIENEADAKEILAEVEKVFGSGAVQELAGEIQAQEQAQPGGATGQQSLAHGGVAGGDGMDDSVQAKLTPGELVVSNPQLSDYGNGDRAVGAQKLQEHLANVSQAHRGSADTPQRVNPAALV